MPTEADTCRKSLCRSSSCGLDSDPHSIAEQRSFTDGRIVVARGQGQTQKEKRAIICSATPRDFPSPSPRPRPNTKQAAMDCSKPGICRYSRPEFAYATNGKEIIEFDFIPASSASIETFPSPGELWLRLRAAEKLTDDPLPTASSHRPI